MVLVFILVSIRGFIFRRNRISVDIVRKFFVVVSGLVSISEFTFRSNK